MQQTNQNLFREFTQSLQPPAARSFLRRFTNAVLFSPQFESHQLQLSQEIARRGEKEPAFITHRCSPNSADQIHASIQSATIMKAHLCI